VEVSLAAGVYALGLYPSSAVDYARFISSLFTASFNPFTASLVVVPYPSLIKWAASIKVIGYWFQG